MLFESIINAFPEDRFLDCFQTILQKQTRQVVREDVEESICCFPLPLRGLYGRFCFTGKLIRFTSCSFSCRFRQTESLEEETIKNLTMCVFLEDLRCVVNQEEQSIAVGNAGTNR